MSKNLVQHDWVYWHDCSQHLTQLTDYLAFRITNHR